ncbi:hypothetical protein GW916_04770 [bacterium]|nr:hypothetical protein [bacterium]
MKLKGLHKRILSLFTMVTFTLGMLAPDVMQAAQSGDQDMKMVASILNNSKKAYGDQEKGIDLFSETVLSALPKSDIKFVKGVLSNVGALPSAEFKNGAIHLTSGDKQLTVKLVNRATGETLVNGKRFTYHANQSLKSNYDRLFKTVNGSEISWVDALMNIVIPQAHAADEESDSGKKGIDWKTIALVVGGIIAVGLVVWWGMTASKEKTKRQESDNAASVDIAKINASVAKHAETQKTTRELGYPGEGGSGSESSGGDSHEL